MKNLLFSSVEQYRYERKFYIEDLTAKEIESILRFHPAMFSETYCQRTVNNIYLDSFGLQHYLDNVNGADRRLKIRIRWYGNLFGFVENPALEIKLKHNMHVGKLIYPLKPFTFDKDFSIETVRRIFNDAPLHGILKLHLAELNFFLLNSYNRRYFLSSDQRYRVTLDKDMRIYKLSPYRNSFLHASSDNKSTILELKYAAPHDECAGSITRHFPFRMTRNSKYADGIQKMYI